MKRLKPVLFCIIILSILLNACTTQNSESHKELILNSNYIKLDLFDSRNLVAEAVNLQGEIQWENSSPQTVEIKTEGPVATLTAISPGEAVIKARLGEEFVSECRVEVPVSAERMVLSGYMSDKETEIDLIAGSEMPVETEVMVAGEKFAKANIRYWIENTEVASIDENGVIKALAPGKTQLKVRAYYYENFSNELNYTINVKPGNLLKVNASNITLFEAVSNPYYKSSFQLDVAVQTGDTEVIPTYSVNNPYPNIVSVNNGLITAVGEGTAKLTITCTHDEKEYTALIYVTVKPVPEVEVFFEEHQINLFNYEYSSSYSTREEIKAYALIDGKTVDNSSIRMEVTEGQDVIAISEDGFVNAIKEGFAEITAYFEYAGEIYSDTCTVNVDKPFRIETPNNYGRKGAVVSLGKGNSVVYEGLSLNGKGDRNDVLFRIQKLPEKIPESFETDPYNKEQLREAMFIFFTLTNSADSSESITIALRAYLTDSFRDGQSAGSRVGVRAISFPPTELGGLNVESTFLGLFNDSATDSRCAMGSSTTGYGAGITFSFYGKYLNVPDNNKTDYEFGVALEGSSVYVHNGGNVIKVWDLNEDTKLYAQTFPDGIIKEEHAFKGFSENANLTLTVSGGIYAEGVKNFDIIFTEIQGEIPDTTVIQQMKLQ